MKPRAAQAGLEDLRRALPWRGVRDERVSAWSVGEHIHHCCLASIAIADGLASSTPPAPRTWRTLLGRVVLWRGSLPRGRARTPEFARPPAVETEARLTELLGRTEARLAQAAALPPDAWIRHFALGVLTRDRALRFVAVHHAHHLRILAEIRAAGAP